MRLHSNYTPTACFERQEDTVNLPEPDRQLLDPAPVRRVICQLRFDSSEQIGTSQLGRDWATELGDVFPRFDQLQSEVLSIKGSTDQPSPMISQGRERGWRFADHDEATIVTLLPGSVALETSTYSGWDAFADLFDRVVRLLFQTVSPALEQRLGLRYINELGHGPEAVREQVDDEVVGLRAHPEIGELVHRVEQRALIDLGNRLRALVRFHSADSHDPSTLDIDVYRENGRPFDVDAVPTTLRDLNTHALRLFQACLNDQYLAELRTKGTQ